MACREVGVTGRGMSRWGPSGRSDGLLVRLELGIPAGAVGLGRHAGTRLTRGEYQQLLKAGLCSGDEVDAASDERIAACVGGDLDKVQVVREAVAGRKAELQPQAEPVLPEYEG
jgi:helicase